MGLQSYQLAITATGLDLSPPQNYAYVRRGIPYSLRSERVTCHTGIDEIHLAFQMRHNIRGRQCNFGHVGGRDDPLRKPIRVSNA